MYTLISTKAIKRMYVNKVTDYILEKYYKRIGISKESCYY